MVKTTKWKRFIAHVVLILAGVFFLAPFVFMLSTSLKPLTQIFTYPPEWIPKPFMWSNYTKAIDYIPFWSYWNNTVMISVLCTVGAMFICPVVAYSFARLQWRGRNLMFMLTLAVMMIPGQVTMIPLFLIFRELNWVGTALPLIVPAFFGIPFYIFLMRQFFMQIPMDLEDAARIDGASEWRIYGQIMLPLAMPAALTVGLFQFMGSWTDFMGPLIYLTNQKQYTLSIGLQQFQSEYGSEWGMLMATSVMMTLPIIIMFFFLQKRFIQGISFSGVKG